MIRGLIWGGLLAGLAAGCGDTINNYEAAPIVSDGGDAGAPTQGIAGEEAGATSSVVGAAGAGGAAADPSSAGAGGAPEIEQPTAGAPQGGSDVVAGSGGTAGADGAQGGQPSAGAPQGGSAGAPPVCACTSGECCDGCHFLPATHLCEVHALRSVTCGPLGNGDFSTNILKQYGDLSCSGKDADCTQWKDTQSVVTGCPSNQICSKPNGTDQCHPL